MNTDIRRRLKPHLQKRSLPPQTEENNLDRTAVNIQPAEAGFVCVSVNFIRRLIFAV